MTWPISGDRAATSASSTTSSTSTSAAWPIEVGMCSGGAAMVVSAATPSSAALVRVRQFTGVELSSPKQPQPSFGRRTRSR
jgi:hypothetical protein